MIILIIGSYIPLCFNRHNISDYETKIIDGFDLAFVLLFIVEMFIGIIARNFLYYLKKPSNIFDIFINILGITEVIMTYASNPDGIFA